MNKKKINLALANYPEAEVTQFLVYLENAWNEEKPDRTIKNPWLRRCTDEQIIEIYKKVSRKGVFIDGETVTLAWKKKLTVNYDYQAYKNRMLYLYPETTWDAELVHKNDEFKLGKDSGTITYTHDIADPFNKKREIIGAYCVIRNNRGEFIETINMDDVTKMRRVSKTDTVWSVWFDRMVLKSVIKRACKTYFYEEIKDIEKIDNDDNYDLSGTNATSTVYEKVKDFDTETALLRWANSREALAWSDDPKYKEAVKARLVELRQDNNQNA